MGAYGMMKKRRIKKRHILFGLSFLIIAALIGARIYLPYWLKDYVNGQLAAMKNYHGRVESIDVALIRGAYAIHGLRIDKRTGKMPVPFLTIRKTDLSLQWSALFEGRIVSDIHADGAVLNFAKNRSGTVVQTGADQDWTAPVKKLMPIDINIITIRDSKVSYRDFSSSPEVNIFLHDLTGEVKNLRNVEDREQALPSPFKVSGTSIGGGTLTASGRLNILKRISDLQGELKLEGADLTAINSYSRAYAAFDFEKGRLDAYAELVIKDGAVNGYLKPIASGIQIIDQRKKDKNVLETLWEPVAAALVEVFSNQSKDQLATRVRFKGRIDSVETPFWPTVGGILRNAFIEAFTRRVDGRLDFFRDSGDGD